MGDMQYAGFGSRFLAILIDGLLLVVVNLILMLIGLNIVSIVVGWLYFALMESSEKQATIGKQVMKLKVTDMNGNRISFGQATGRYFSKIVSTLIILIGYIMAAFTEKKQALHDMMAGTLVYQSDAATISAPRRPRNSGTDNDWNDGFNSLDNFDNYNDNDNSSSFD